MTYAPLAPVLLSLALAAGCATSDHRVRALAQGEVQKMLVTGFEARADDYVEAKVSAWAGWLAAAAGAVGLAGGGGMLKAWQGARKGGKV